MTIKTTGAMRMLILMGMIVLFSYAANACTCSRISHRKEFRQSDLIFAGQVIGISEDKSFVSPILSDPNLPPESLARLQRMVDRQKQFLVKFRIERNFKGAAGGEITLDMIQSESPCSGIEFGAGEAYLVYASRGKDGVHDNGLCSRTRKLDVTSKEYKELGSFWFRLKARFI